MKIIIVTLVLCVLLVGSVPTPASAIVMCISQRDDDRCQPTDGSEPPADCGWPGFWQRIRIGWQNWQEWGQDQLDRI